MNALMAGLTRRHETAGNYELRRSLKLLKIESVITTAMFSMPVLNVFFKDELGMSLAQVGLSQAIFTVVVLLLNIPTGYLADRTSRRACNVTGDIIAAVGFAYYALAGGFWDVVVGEIILGVGLSLSGGADVGLIRAHTQKLGLNYAREFAAINRWRPPWELTAVMIGGVIGSFSPRIAIAMSALTMTIGAILAYKSLEIGERRVSEQHPLRDMMDVVKYGILDKPGLRWRIFAYAIGREITHPAVWLLTPLLLAVGVPTWLLGVGWAINLLAVWLGAHAAHRYAYRLADWQVFAIGTTAALAAAGVLAINISAMTVLLYACFGLARGWGGSTLMPILQRDTPDSMQSTIVSGASVVAQLLYAPLVWLLGAMGDQHLGLAFGANFGIFLLPAVIIGFKLYRYAR